MKLLKILEIAVFRRNSAGEHHRFHRRPIGADGDFRTLHAVPDMERQRCAGKIALNHQRYGPILHHAHGEPGLGPGGDSVGILFGVFIAGGGNVLGIIGVTADADAHGSHRLYPVWVRVRRECVEQHPLGIRRPDSGHQLTQFAFSIREIVLLPRLNLIAEIECEIPAGDPSIASCQHGPVVLYHGPLGIVGRNGVTGLVIAAFIQIKTHGNLNVDTVFHAPGDELIQIPQLVFVDQTAVLRVVREPEGGEAEKDPGKVEAIVSQKLDICLSKVGAKIAAAVILAAAKTGALPLGRQLGLGHFRQIGFGVQQVVGNDAFVIGTHVRELHIHALRLQRGRTQLSQPQDGADGLFPGQRVLEMGGLPFKVIGIDGLTADLGDHYSAGGETAPHVVAIAPCKSSLFPAGKQRIVPGGRVTVAVQLLHDKIDVQMEEVLRRILLHEYHGIGRGQDAVLPLHFLIGFSGKGNGILPLTQAAFIPNANQVGQHLAILPEGNAGIVVLLDLLRYQTIRNGAAYFVRTLRRHHLGC